MKQMYKIKVSRLAWLTVIIVVTFSIFFGFLFIRELRTTSLMQAVEDLDLILKLTGVLIIFLLAIGWFIDHRSLRKELQHTEYMQRNDVRQTWRNNFVQGISTEFIGAAMTAFLFSIILLIFQQYQSIENDKVDLILQMGSPDHSLAVEAVRIAEQKGWLVDGTFENAYLPEAKLSRANFGNRNRFEATYAEDTIEHHYTIYVPYMKNLDSWSTDLSGAYLVAADLSGANLVAANLTGADLVAANLTGANLQNANLTGADLWGANLIGANLQNANLTGVDLQNANLTGVDLQNANLTGADLQNANLTGVDLQNANLTGADLQNVNLENMKLGGNHGENPATLPDGTVWEHGNYGENPATLPDGTVWERGNYGEIPATLPDGIVLEIGIDMGKFTDPEHPEYQATLEKINAIREEMGIDLISA